MRELGGLHIPLLLLGSTGACVGAIAVREMAGWSPWIAFPVGGLIGAVLHVVGVFVLVGSFGCLVERLRRRQQHHEASSVKPANRQETSV